MAKVKVSIDPHDGINKSFTIDFPHLAVAADYDDVDHPEVDAAARTLKEIVEKHWDEDLFKHHFKEEIMRIWYKNEYNLQDDYEGDLEEYLGERGLTRDDVEEFIKK